MSWGIGLLPSLAAVEFHVYRMTEAGTGSGLYVLVTMRYFFLYTVYPDKTLC